MAATVHTATATAVDAIETEDRMHVRNVAYALKLVLENDCVEVPWRPFMALCEAVYPFFNPVVFHRQMMRRGTWVDRLDLNCRNRSDEVMCGMLVEAAAVGAGAERCARQMRARFHDRRLTIGLISYLQCMAQKRSTMRVYGTLDALLRRYDVLAALPCSHNCNLYCCYNDDPAAVAILLRRSRVSLGAMLGALRASVKRRDGVFIDCLRWATDDSGTKDAHERVAAGQMMSLFDACTDRFLKTAARYFNHEVARAISESPMFVSCECGSARTGMLKFIARFSNDCRCEHADEEYDQMLRAIGVQSEIQPEFLYRGAVQAGEYRNFYVMHKLIDVLESRGGVTEFKDVDRSELAEALSGGRLWGEWSRVGRDRACDVIAAKIVRLVKARPLLAAELEVSERDRMWSGGDGESVAPPDAKRRKLE